MMWVLEASRSPRKVVVLAIAEALYTEIAKKRPPLTEKVGAALQSIFVAKLGERDI